VHLVPETSWARVCCIYSAAFDIAWFPGSALYDISIPLLVVVSVVALPPSPLSPNSPR
jgi:hypothetical protein